MIYTWCKEVLWQQEGLSWRFEGEKEVQEDKTVIREERGSPGQKRWL